MDVQAVLLRPSAQLRHQITELLLVCNVKVILVTEEDHAALRYDDGEVADELLCIRCVENVRDFDRGVLATNDGRDLKVRKFIERSRVLEWCWARRA